MRGVRRGLCVVLPCLLLLACATQRALQLEPVRGVTRVVATPVGWQMTVPGGIGRFRVRLPADAVGEITLVYADGRPFARLEGVQVVGHPGDTHPAVASDGRGRVRVRAAGAPLDLTLIVIDYYR